MLLGTETGREGVKIWRSRHLEGVELMRAEAATGYSLARHFHEEIEISLKTRGSGELFYRGERRLVPEGHFSLTYPGEAHTSYSSGEGGVAMRGLRIEPVLLWDAAEQLAKRRQAPPFFPIAVVDDGSLASLFLGLHRKSEEDSASRLEQQSLLLVALTELIARYAENRPTPRRVRNERRAVRLVREYLEDNHAENVSLEDLASVANLSPFHLSRSFRKEVGLPPHEYQTQVRVLRAKALLIRGVPIAQAAFDTGFASQSHFTRYFKRLVGVTPGAFLKDSKNVV